MRSLAIMLSFSMLTPAVAQDFLDSLQANEAAALSCEVDGFMRGAFFAGKSVSGDELEQKSAYGEIGVKLRARKAQWGGGYGEIRLRRGYEFDESLSDFQLREAYVDASRGDFDFRMGHQIIARGRADAFNPTNNITPQDLTPPSLREFTSARLDDEDVDGVACYQIEWRPADDAIADENGFSKRITLVGKEDFVVRKSIYYDLDGELLGVAFGRNQKHLNR
ncbi:outer membrane lipoprotein-sorting protein [candidate division KSB1 bacterium]|nr:MAG: outer membrane lipoprotein-sorting protein [candidate division KSB1 bacterium]